MSLAIEMPDAVMRAIKVPEQEVPARLRRELAIRLYSRSRRGRRGPATLRR